jgi:hypothetical protein
MKSPIKSIGIVGRVKFMVDNLLQLVNYFDENLDWLYPTIYRVTEYFKETKVYEVENIIATIEFGAIYLNDAKQILLQNACQSFCFLVKHLVEPVHISDNKIIFYFKNGQTTIEKIN